MQHPNAFVRALPILFAIISVSAAGSDLRLLEAAKQRDQAAVRTLLKEGVDVNARLSDGSTAILWAAYHDDTETVALLIGAHADVNLANAYGETPLSVACQNRNAALAGALLKAGANPNVVKPSGETTLMTAARGGNVDIVKALIARGVPVNARETSKNQTALMWAVARNHAAVVDTLLQAGAEVNAASTSGSTPLHFAVQQGNVATAKLLLAHGASVQAKMSVRQIDGFTLGLVETLEGQTPLLLAITDCRRDGLEFYGSTTILPSLAASCPASEQIGELLLEHDADPNAPDGSEIQPLHQAVHAGMVNLAKALLAKGADVNARVPATARQWTGKNRNGARSIRPIPVGATPLFVAAWWHNVELMRILFAAGADPRLMPGDKTTTLMAAAGVAGRPPMGYSSRLDTRAMLEAATIALDHGDDLNGANDAGQTAMHGAAKLRSNELIQFLADRGARVDVKDREGQTPLSLAGQREYMVEGEKINSTVELLKKLAGQPTAQQ